MPESCAAFIDRIISERHSKGMTQAELAEASGLTQSAVTRLESKKAVPQLDTLLKVAAALDCEIAIKNKG